LRSKEIVAAHRESVSRGCAAWQVEAGKVGAQDIRPEERLSFYGHAATLASRPEERISVARG
jgi:hypothetical protein